MDEGDSHTLCDNKSESQNLLVPLATINTNRTAEDASLDQVPEYGSIKVNEKDSCVEDVGSKLQERRIVDNQAEGRKSGKSKLSSFTGLSEELHLKSNGLGDVLTLKKVIADITTSRAEAQRVHQDLKQDHALSSSGTFSAKAQGGCSEIVGPAAAVEVTVCGVPKCDLDKSPTADSNQWRCARQMGVQDSGCESWVDHQESVRCDAVFSLRSTQNLSKSPISVITVSAGSTKPTCCEDSVLTRASEVLPVPRQEKFGNHASASIVLEPDPDTQTATEKTTSATSINPEQSCPKTEDRPIARRRLSETIQNLQNKLQQEMASNENRSDKEYQADAGPSESKRLPGRMALRYNRDRSRKRSKSRAAFKVFQRARIFPPVSVKERPYRQWMGVGTCVTPDTRYIVSSRQRESDSLIPLSLASEEPIDVESISENNDATICCNGGNVEECFSGNKEAEIKSELNIKKSNTDNLTKGLDNRCRDKCPEISSTDCRKEGKLDNKAKDVTVESACATQLASSETEINSIKQEPSYPDALAVNKITAHPSRPARERSRCMKKAVSGKDRKPRPPTPHSKSSLEEEVTADDLPTGSRTTSSAPWSGARTHTLSREFTSSPCNNSPLLSRLIAGERKIPGQRVVYSPAVRRLRRRGSSSTRHKFLETETLSTLKTFTAAPKQQKRPSKCVNPHFSMAVRKSAESHITRGHDSVGAPLRCGMTLALPHQETSCHGSIETLWSDASTTTWESSVHADDGADSHGWAIPLPDHKREAFTGPRPQRSGSRQARVTSVKNAEARKYVDVQAVVDFKGSLPGQLSFRKGQIMKQMIYMSPGTEDEMSYGYYRVGRFKRKRKGLFPSSCVTLYKPGF